MTPDRAARPRPGGALWWALFLTCLMPLARLVARGVQGGLGANPVEFVTRSTGTWTLVLLCVTLALTPIKRLTGWTQVIRYRRMLGLFTFFYGCLHFTTYVWLDQWFEWPDIVRDVLKRPFITVGFAAFLLMAPLALTSTRAAMRRLGRRWQTLHRLIYAVAVLAILSAGAYGMAMSSNYNTRPRAAEVMLDVGGDVHRVRERETVESLYALERRLPR